MQAEFKFNQRNHSTSVVTAKELPAIILDFVSGQIVGKVSFHLYQKQKQN